MQRTTFNLRIYIAISLFKKMVKFNVQLIFHGRPKTLDAVECVLPIVNVHVYSFVLQ